MWAEDVPLAVLVAISVARSSFPGFGVCSAYVLPLANVRFSHHTPPTVGRSAIMRRWKSLSSLSSSSSSSEEAVDNAFSLRDDDDGEVAPSPLPRRPFPPVPVRSHHACVKTRSMEMALAFYSLLGYEPEAKFRAGPARAAWLTNVAPSDDNDSDSEGSGEGYGAVATVPSRIEIIEVPPEALDEAEGVRKRAADRFANPALLGLDHICLDVTGSILSAREGTCDNKVGDYEIGAAPTYGLSEWMDDLQSSSDEKFGKTLRVALSPRVKRIGRNLIEMAYIYDADGSLLELINCDVRISGDGQDMEGDTKEKEDERRESSWDDEDDGRIVWKAG